MAAWALRRVASALVPDPACGLMAFRRFRQLCRTGNARRYRNAGMTVFVTQWALLTSKVGLPFAGACPAVGFRNPALGLPSYRVPPLVVKRFWSCAGCGIAGV